MLITLKQLLVVIGLFLMGLLGGLAVAKGVGLGEGPGVLACVLSAHAAVLLLAWPVFKGLRLRPLILPTCPACGKRHGNYSVPAEAWPVAVLICPCGQALKLNLGDGPRAETGPIVTPRWPAFLGRWTLTR